MCNNKHLLAYAIDFSIQKQLTAQVFGGMWKNGTENTFIVADESSEINIMKNKY